MKRIVSAVKKNITFPFTSSQPPTTKQTGRDLGKELDIHAYISKELGLWEYYTMASIQCDNIKPPLKGKKSAFSDLKMVKNPYFKQYIYCPNGILNLSWSRTNFKGAVSIIQLNSYKS